MVLDALRKRFLNKEKKKNKRHAQSGRLGQRCYIHLEPLEERALLAFVHAPGSPYPLAAGANPQFAPALGDFNNDGRPDLVTANGGTDNVSVLFGNANGSFTLGPTTPTGGSFPTAIAVGFFDAGPNLDIAVTNFLSDSFSIMLGDGAGGFVQAPGSPVTLTAGSNPVGIVAGTVDADGVTDLVIANGGLDTVNVLRGIGNGTFSVEAPIPTGGTDPRLLTLGKFNGDDFLDLAITNSGTDNVSILLGAGNGTFAPAAGSPILVGDFPFGIAAGALNGDGFLDLAVTNGSSASVSVLLGDGAGGFSTAGTNSPLAVGASPRGLAIADLNGDLFLDIVTANNTSSNVSVLSGNGNGTFQAAVNTPSAVGASGVVVGLFDGNLAPDLAVTNTSVDSVSSLLNQDAVFAGGIINVFGDQGLNFNDDFQILLDPTGQFVEVWVNNPNRLGLPNASAPKNAVNQINVSGLNGNDTLTVINSNGLVIVPNGIIFNGGTGSDLLRMTGNLTTSTTYNPGFTNDSGTLLQTNGGLTQRVEFTQLEPLQVLGGGVASTLNIGSLLPPNSLNANNAINYTAGPNSGAGFFFGFTSGLVSVDAYETIEFANYGTLLINAGAGSDHINLNNPNAPTALGNITVNAGDPTGSDTLVINGRPGVQDQLRLAPTATGNGTVTGFAMPVNFTGIEHLKAVLQPLASDHFTVDGMTGNDDFHIATSAIAGNIQITGLMNGGAGPAFPLPIIDVTGNSQTLIGTFNFNGVGGNDRLTLVGVYSNEAFNLARANATSGSINQFVNGTQNNFIGFANFGNITIEGADGDDIFNVPGDFPTTLHINGGSPSSGSDVLKLTGAAAAENVVIAPDATNPTEQDITGVANPINVNGIELITYTGTPLAGVRNDSLTINPRADNDMIRIANQAVVTSTARVTSLRLPEIHFTGLNAFSVDTLPANAGVIEATFVTQNLDPATAYLFNSGSEDVLTIEGAETFQDSYVVSNGTNLGLSGGTTLVTDISTAPGPVVAVASIVAAVAAPSFVPGEVRIKTKGGDDLVTIDTGGGGATAGAVYAPLLAATGLTAPLDLIDTRIVYDGGTGGDVLNVIGSPATAVTNVVYTPGPDPTSGRIDYGTAGFPANTSGTSLIGMMQIEFTSLQPVVDVVPALNLIVNANNQINTITYSEGINALGFAANTGLVSVDNHETIEFANKGNLTLNGLAGDDTILLQNTAAAVPTGLLRVIANGGLGNDTIDGFSNLTTPLTLNGDGGNDVLIGGPASDNLVGGAGDDRLVLDVRRNNAVDTFTGHPANLAGIDFDTLVIRGSGFNDVIDVTQNAPAAPYVLSVTTKVGSAASVGPTLHLINGTGALPAPPSIDEVRIEAGAGNDNIRVAHVQNYFTPGGANAAQMLRFHVDGGVPNASDRLFVQDLGIGDVVLVRQAPDERSGRVTVAPAVPGVADIVYDNIENIEVPAVNPITGRTGTDALGRAVVFQADPFEMNDNLLVATDITDLTRIHRSPNIDPGNAAVFGTPDGDEDWYEVRATQSGTFQLDMLFTAVGPLGNGQPGLPGGGALAVGVYNSAGLLIAAGSTLINSSGVAIGQSLQFTASPGTSFFVRVTGSPLPGGTVSASAAINNYDLRLTVLDNLGPQIFDPDGPNFPAQAISIVGAPFFDLFANKPANAAAGPTPPVNGLTITFRDPVTANQIGTGPGAILGALDAASALSPGSYKLVGDATGEIAIANVAFALPQGIVAGSAVVTAASEKVFTGGAGLSAADDFYTGQTLEFTSGANQSFNAIIIGYTGATRTFRFATPFPAVPGVGDTFVISPDFVITPVNVLGTAVVTAASTNVVVNLGAGGVTGAGLSTVPGTYVGQALQITSGLLLGETRTITAYNGAGQFTVSGAVVANGFSAAPAVTDTFNIVGTPNSASSIVAAGPPLTASSFVGGAGLSALANFYVGQAVQFTSGPLAGQARVITGYTGTGAPLFTFAAPFSAAPNAGDAFVVVPALAAPLANTVFAAGSALTFTGGFGAAGVGLSPTAGDYVGQLLQFTSGPLLGQAQLITSYNGAGVFTFANPFNAAPAAGATFNILPISAAAVTLTFASPLPDDRFTLTVFDSIRDPAGNKLDGESNAAQPVGTPAFPSGNGVSGGNFVARFTVDTRPEIGTVSAGSVYIDINGNFLFDPQNVDAVNRDITFNLGFTSDAIFAGNFVQAAGGVASGFDKLAAYGLVGNNYRWIIDTNHDGVADLTVIDPARVAGLPVAGDFDGNAVNGDEVALFDGSRFWIDANHDFNVDASFATPIRGYPIVGDFDGDGFDDLGTWRDDQFFFDLAFNGFGQQDGGVGFTLPSGFLGVRERPVAADMNMDGIDDIGLWVPDRSGAAPSELGEWYFMVSGQGGAPGSLATLNHPFTPVPFGRDIYAQFGDQWAVPIVGNFDPPVTSNATSTTPPTNTNTTPPATTGSSNTGSTNTGSSNTGSSNSTMPTPSIPTAAVTPSITIDDATISEGTGGAKSLMFTVRLSAATSDTVTVRYGTANGTAVSTKDYSTAAGTLTFAPGVTTQQIVVPITTDNIDEVDETFVLNLKKPSKATIADSQAIGTIFDDDAAPVVSIDNVAVNESDSGRANSVFTISLSNPSSQTVKVQFATVDGTAGATDYRALSNRTIAFGPGVVSQKVTVQVNGDRVAETNETFTVQLLGAVAATLGNSQGVGTIIDNDSAPAALVLPPTTPQNNAPASSSTSVPASTNPPADNNPTSTGPSLAESLAAPKTYGPRRPSSSTATVQDISLLEYLQGFE